MEPQITNHLAPRLRAIRESSGLGSRVEASESTGFNKNNIASYESGQSLPPIDYLFVFADRTGADINELIRLRLACSRYESARALANTVRVQAEQPVDRNHTASQGAHGQVASELDRDRLRRAVKAMEKGLSAGGIIMPPGKKAGLLLAVYDMLEEPGVTEAKVINLVIAAATSLYLE